MRTDRFAVHRRAGCCGGPGPSAEDGRGGAGGLGLDRVVVDWVRVRVDRVVVDWDQG